MLNAKSIITLDGKMQKLLLHVCCAPCSTAVIEKLATRFHLVLYFFNPNIHPQKEYYYRLQELKEFGQKIDLEVHAGDYSIKEWFALVKGHEKDLEKSGSRCALCIGSRLRACANKAKELNCSHFATTLSISPHKNVFQINELGQNIARAEKLDFLAEDYKQDNGFRRSVELSKEYGMYRQNYCGCVFSYLERRRIS